MKHLIALLILSTAVLGGIKEAKRSHQSKLKALHVKYLVELNYERQRALRGRGNLEEIDKEINRVNNILYPFPKACKVTYTTGIRHYEFRTSTHLYWVEGRQNIPYKRSRSIIIISHPTGAVETWERKKSGGGFVVVFAVGKKNILGEAVIEE